VEEHCPGISRGTAHRYTQLAQRLGPEQALGLGLTECYRLAGILPELTAEAVLTPPTSRPPERPDLLKPARPPAHGWPAWAVPDPSGAGPLPHGAAVPPTAPSDQVGDTDPPGEDEVLSGVEVQREEIGGRLPFLLDTLSEAAT
jgi:hypothetical protein